MGSNMANVSGQLPDEASSNDTGPNTTGKRLSDRDVEYLSSNPRKKRRQTEQTLAAISATVNQPSAATFSPVPVKHDIPSHSQTSSADRCLSTSGVDQQGDTHGLMSENMGASAPDFTNFEFPQPHHPESTSLRQFSEDISPKQIPQSLPSAPSEKVAEHPAPPVVAPPAQDSFNLEQLCPINFPGLPTDTLGFAASGAYGNDSGISSGPGTTNVGAAQIATPAFDPSGNSLVNPNTIPFGMCSARSLVPAMQMHFASQLATAFGSVPMHGSSQGVGMPPRTFHGLPSAGHQNLAGKAYGSLPAKHSSSCRVPGVRYQAQDPLRMSANPKSQAPANPAPNNYRPSTLRSAHPVQGRHLPPGPHIDSRMLALGSSIPGTELTPSLLQDIARTIQLHFPCQQVALRHGINANQVAELILDLVIRPLLRGNQLRPPGTG